MLKWKSHEPSNQKQTVRNKEKDGLYDEKNLREMSSAVTPGDTTHITGLEPCYASKETMSGNLESET